MPRICAFICFLGFGLSAIGQQVAPVELLTEPEKYSFALSGSLIGNVDNEQLNTDTRSGRTSGRLFLDAYITPRLFASVHINALQSKDYLLDISNIANLAFSHNNYKFYLGLDYNGKETKTGHHSWFGNYSMSSVALQDSVVTVSTSQEFTLYKINLGIQFQWKADWDQNLLVHGSLKFNRLWIEDPVGKVRALENAFGISPEETLQRIYNGFGMKMIIQLNNISIFFETQVNSIGKDDPGQMPIPGFVEHTFYSIGFTSNSTAILGKRKEVKDEEPVVKEDAGTLKEEEVEGGLEEE